MNESAPVRWAKILRSVAGLTLVAVALAALAIGLSREAKRGSGGSAPPDTAARPYDEGSVVVYYFHGEFRCETCLAIEARTAEVVRRVFAEEIAGGAMRFEIVDFDEPANEHFRDDYDLAYGTVVVQGAGADGGWEELADVWTYIHAEGTAFEDYLVEHINRMLDTTG